jgi:hypothetical protein
VKYGYAPGNQTWDGASVSLMIKILNP